MSTEKRPLQKIRTFQEDFKRAHGSTPSIEKEVAVTVPPQQPTHAPLPKMAPVTVTAPNVPRSFEELVASEKTKVVTKVRPVPQVSTSIKTPAEPVAPAKTSVNIAAEALAIEPITSDTKESILTHNNIFDVAEADKSEGEGTIITDTKNNRFKLLPAIIAGMQHWFTEIRDKHLKKKDPQHTIEATSDRFAEVLAAAEQSALAPKDDFSKLTARVATIERPAVETKGITIKNASEVQAPSWSYTNDETTLVAPATVPPMNVSQSSDLLQEQVPIETVVDEKTNELPVIIEEAVPPIATASTATKEAMAVVDEPPIYQSSDAPWPSQPLDFTEDDAFLEPAGATSAPQSTYQPSPAAAALVASMDTVETSPTDTQAVARQYRTTTPPTDLVPWAWRLRIGAVALIAILLGFSVTMWLFGDKNETVVVQPNIVATIVPVDEAIAIALPTTRTNLLQSIIETKPQSAQRMQVYPVTNISGDTVPATAGQIIAVLDPQFSSAMARTIETLQFGYNESEPYIVMKVSSFDIGLSSMLGWEKVMSADLAPLFGTPVRSTFDPQARTSDIQRAPFFSDSVTQNIDVRVLRDENNNDRIVYGFFDRNTLIITTTNSSYASLVQTLR